MQTEWALPPPWKPNSRLAALTAGSDPGHDGGSRCNNCSNDQAAASTASWGSQLCCTAPVS